MLGKVRVTFRELVLPKIWGGLFLSTKRYLISVSHISQGYSIVNSGYLMFKEPVKVIQEDALAVVVSNGRP